MTKGVVDSGLFGGGKKSDFKDQILGLQDGQTIDLDNPRVRDAGDAWDRDLKTQALPLYLAKLDRDPDQTYSTGSVKMRSLGNLTATRKGDIVEINGDVYHTLQDKYDFNNETFSDKELFGKYADLAYQNQAKPFRIYGSKAQRLKGTINLDDGKIKNSQFDWMDKNQ